MQLPCLEPCIRVDTSGLLAFHAFRFSNTKTIKEPMKQTRGGSIPLQQMHHR